MIQREPLGFYAWHFTIIPFIRSLAGSDAGLKSLTPIPPSGTLLMTREMLYR